MSGSGDGQRKAVAEAGATVVLLAPEKDTIQAFNHDVDKADTFQADEAVKNADPAFNAKVVDTLSD